MKKVLALIVSVAMCFGIMSDVWMVKAQPKEQTELLDEKLDIQAESAILQEVTTGKVLYEKKSEQKMAPASVTKIMTLLLIFDALNQGKIHLHDSVTVSENAAAMGGSQVFLEPEEIQTVETMIKCIAVASANDACVSMAEYICGNEEAFVKCMNQKARELGMCNTHFVNCNGLDAEGHLTTARDIAVMSRELITKYPEIHKYSTIWMENIMHKTKKGEKEFGLVNTNKMIRHYPYATGLKTGSTSKAKFCISATGEKDGVQLIAVIMAAPSSKQRVKDAVTLLNYGFGKCQIYRDMPKNIKPYIEVKKGKQKGVYGYVKDEFIYVDTEGERSKKLQKKIRTKDSLKAPIKQGDKIGSIEYYFGKKEVGTLPICASKTVAKIDIPFAINRVVKSFLL